MHLSIILVTNKINILCVMDFIVRLSIDKCFMSPMEGYLSNMINIMCLFITHYLFFQS